MLDTNDTRCRRWHGSKTTCSGISGVFESTEVPFSLSPFVFSVEIIAEGCSATAASSALSSPAAVGSVFSPEGTSSGTVPTGTATSVTSELFSFFEFTFARTTGTTGSGTRRLPIWPPVSYDPSFPKPPKATGAENATDVATSIANVSSFASTSFVRGIVDNKRVAVAGTI